MYWLALYIWLLVRYMTKNKSKDILRDKQKENSKSGMVTSKDREKSA